jgi:O-antigen/teichoic acid export membrane protein
MPGNETRARARLVGTVRWSALDGFATIASSVLTLLLLGWYFSPHQVGLAGIAVATVMIIEAISGLGMREAIIRSGKGGTRESDTAHTLVIVGTGVGILVALGAAFALSAAFANEELAPLIIVAAATLPLNAVSAIATALQTRRLRARHTELRSVTTRLVTVAALWILGALGLGALAIVLAGVIAAMISPAVTLATTRRWPQLRYDAGHARLLLRFGLIAGLDDLVHVLSVRGFILVFGLIHGAVALGQMQLALRAVDELSRVIQSGAWRFGAAFFSKLEAGSDAMARAYVDLSRVLFAVAAPLFAGLAVVGPLAVPLVLGQDWAPSGAFLQLMALGWLLAFPFLLNRPVLRAVGAPAISTAWTSASALIAFAGTIATAPLGASWGVASWALRDVPSQPLVSAYVYRRLELNVVGHLGGLFRIALAVVIMATVVAAILSAPLHAAMALGVAVLAAAVVYPLALLALDRATFARIRRLLPGQGDPVSGERLSESMTNE